MDSLAARKVLLFSAGGVRLALRVSHLRAVVEVPEGRGGDEGDAELRVRDETLPCARVASILGRPGGRAPYALLVEGPPRAALRVEALHGFADLGGSEVFQLPARTFLPRPAPFSGAIVWKGEIALELAIAALGSPLTPAVEVRAPPADAGAAAERELRFARGDRTFAVPLSLLVQVLEAPRVAPVPLTPPSHLGLLYHGRALHPVLDVAALLGEPPGAPPPRVLLLDAGGTAVAVAADRVLGVAEGDGSVLRPAWDAVLAP